MSDVAFCRFFLDFFLLRKHGGGRGGVLVLGLSDATKGVRGQGGGEYPIPDLEVSGHGGLMVGGRLSPIFHPTHHAHCPQGVISSSAAE